MQTWYQVNEIFDSIQGEGIAIGTPATFIRLQGCPVGCEWCDSGPLADEIWGRQTNGLTRNTWTSGGTRMTVEEILALVHRRLVIITGGEPTIWDLDGLIRPLQETDHLVQLETSGLNELKGKLLPNHITISPKARLKYRIPEILGGAAAEIKWVVDDDLTYETVFDAWQRMGETAIFVLMPEGCPPSKEHIQKTLDILNRFTTENPDNTSDWMFGDRLQYRLGIR